MPGDSLTRDQSYLKEFYESLGWPVVLAGGYLWHSSGIKTYIPLPCWKEFTLSAEEKACLWDKGAWFLRYPCSDSSKAFPSYIYLVDDKTYSLETFPYKRRKEMRRALKHCTVERIPISFLFREGIPLIENTLRRQGRVFNREIVDEWEQYFRSAHENPLFEGWAAFVGTELAAYTINFIFQGGVYGDALFSRDDLLKLQVMHALIFVYTEEAIRRPDITHVSYGIRAPAGDRESLNRFKESVGYKRVSIRERIEPNPKIKPFLDVGLAHLLRFAAGKLQGRHHRADYVYGLFSTYLGQRPRTP